MIGFFSKKETQLSTRLDGKILSCTSCGLYKGDLQHPKLAATGNFKKGILNIGEFTTGWDDRQGKQFQSKQDSIIYSAYKKLGIDLEEDCLNVNAVMCFPYNQRTGKPRRPTTHEIQCCRLKMIALIKRHKPKVIVLFGKTALESIIGHRWEKGVGTIDRWRGWAIPDQFFKAWIVPTFSPAYVTAQESKAVELIWMQDLSKAIRHVDVPFRKYVEPKITVLEKDLSELDNIKNKVPCAFDYETTGLKPHRKEHKIICASIADSTEHAYVFMLINKKNKPISEKRLKPFRKFLINPYIPKIAQNLKFEENWTFVKYKVRVKGWLADTLYWSHILDNRTGTTGLKFQAYVCFGIDSYDDDVAPYLKAKDSNDINSILKLVSTTRGRNACLKYCALDSILELRLYEIQQEQLQDNILPF